MSSHLPSPRVISVVVDNDSWILPYAEQLVAWANDWGDNVRLCRNYQSVQPGFAVFLLGCIKLAPVEVLALNTYNLVVHESDLPKGKGFAPVAWQILEGQNMIPICLINAATKADSGNIYFRDEMFFEGHELSGEIRRKQGEATLSLCKRFLSAVSPPNSIEQEGETTTYIRRSPIDSELDVNLSLKDQFNLLRVVDNEDYPAFFNTNGHVYRLKIEKIDE